MKHLILAILVCLLLIGCGEESTEPQSTNLQPSDLYGWYKMGGEDSPFYPFEVKAGVFNWASINGCDITHKWTFIESTETTITILIEALEVDHVATVVLTKTDYGFDAESNPPAWGFRWEVWSSQC